MKCTSCKQGDTAPGHVTVTLERSGTIVVIRDVPAAVCNDCQDYYLDDAVATQVYQLAEDAVGRNAEVEILRYAA